MRRRHLRTIVITLVVAASAACGSGAPTPAIPAPSPAGTPMLIPTAVPVATTAMPVAATAEEFKVGLCSALEAMATAVGNPDTGSGSILSTALEDATTALDGTTAAGLAARITGILESGRQQIAFAGGWPPGATMMIQLDRIFVAYEAMIAAKVAVARGTPGAPVPQTAFEQAGGVEAWYAMLEAARAMPPGEWTSCFDVFNQAAPSPPAPGSSAPPAPPSVAPSPQ